MHQYEDVFKERGREKQSIASLSFGNAPRRRGAAAAPLESLSAELHERYAHAGNDLGKIAAAAGPPQDDLVFEPRPLDAEDLQAFEWNKK